MRVTHFSYSDGPGGASSAAYRIHQGLRHLGVSSRFWVVAPYRKEPDIVKLKWPGFLSGQLYKFAKLLDARIESKMFRAHGSTVSTGFIGHDPQIAVDADQPDVVQLHWIGGRTLSLRALHRISKPIVWRLPDMWAFCGVEHYTTESAQFINGYNNSNVLDSGRYIRFNKIAWRHKLSCYERIQDLTIVCPSQWLAKLASESVLLRNREVTVIRTGCDVNRFRPMDRKMCRAILGWPEGKKIVLAGADNISDPRKGMDLLLDALNQPLFEKGSHNTELVTFGSRPPDHRTMSFIGLRNVGVVNDALHLSLIYNAADVFVAPSRQENLANTVLEAMACGTPCVAFDIGGMPEIISHKENGFVVSELCPSALASGIDWILNFPNSGQLGASARNRILSSFTLEHQAQQYLRLYSRIIENRGGKPRKFGPSSHF